MGEVLDIVPESLRELLAQLGGLIECTSGDEGTVFDVLLPMESDA